MCREKKFQNTLENMESSELPSAFRRTCVEAKNVEGKPYRRNAIHAGLGRFVSCSPHRKTFSVIRDVDFQSPIRCHLKGSPSKRAHFFHNRHKQPMPREDLEAHYSNDKLGLENPESLVNTAWFYIVLYFGKRGRENQRQMKASDLQLKTTTGGLKYFVLNERATENHRGGISDNEDETQSVMMAWPGRPRCPVTFLDKYLAKREPRCDARLMAKSKESQCRIVLSK